MVEVGLGNVVNVIDVGSGGRACEQPPGKPPGLLYSWTHRVSTV